MTIGMDAFLHGILGVTFSVADYAAYRWMNGKEARMQELAEVRDSIDVILMADKPPEEQEGSPVDPNSLQYATNVHLVRSYLEREGVAETDMGFWKKLGGFFKNLAYGERINGQSWKVQLGEATLIEAGLTLAGGIGENQAGTLLRNFYQIPAMFGGFLAGEYLVRPVLQATTRSREEKDAEDLIQETFRKTQIVDIVMGYTPPSQIQQQLEEKGIMTYAAKLSRSGKRAYKEVVERAGEGADYLLDFGARSRDAEAERRRGHIERMKESTARSTAKPIQE